MNDEATERCPPNERCWPSCCRPGWRVLPAKGCDDLPENGGGKLVLPTCIPPRKYSAP